MHYISHDKNALQNFRPFLFIFASLRIQQHNLHFFYFSPEVVWGHHKTQKWQAQARTLTSILTPGQANIHLCRLNTYKYLKMCTYINLLNVRVYTYILMHMCTSMYYIFTLFTYLPLSTHFTCTCLLVGNPQNNMVICCKKKKHKNKIKTEYQFAHKNGQSYATDHI